MTTTLTLIGLALAPCIYLAIVIYGKDKIHREPKKILLVAFILGGLSFVPVVFCEDQGSQILDHIDAVVLKSMVASFLIAGLIEESFKFLVVRFYAYKQKAFNEPFDGIVCTVFVALGFATIENLVYVLRGGATTGWLRMFTAIPMHYSCAVIIGYFAGKAKFEPHNRTLHMLVGVVLAVLLHGTYDFLIKAQWGPIYWIHTYDSVTDTRSRVGVSIISLAVVLIGWIISKIAIKQLASESVFFFKQNAAIGNT